MTTEDEALPDGATGSMRAEPTGAEPRPESPAALTISPQTQAPASGEMTPIAPAPAIPAAAALAAAQQPPTPTPPPAPSPSWQQPVQPAGPAPGIEFGGPAQRLAAYVVDVVIISIVTFAVLVFAFILVGVGINGNSGLSALVGIFLMVVALVIGLAYFPWFWHRSGATPGMLLFGLKVVRDRDGGPVTTSQALVRLIGYWVSAAVFYIGFIWIFVDERKRGWYDLMAGTVVIRER